MPSGSDQRRFDCFLSHNSADKPWVIRLKDELVRQGLSVWLDQDDLRPSDLFVRALERGIDESKSVVLVVSPEAMKSGWVEEEYSRAAALAQSTSEPLQLIPVILRDAELPEFLANRNWVDFRDKDRYHQSLNQLLFGITGIKCGSPAADNLHSASDCVKQLTKESDGASGEAITNPVGIQLKLIPAGEFMMGASDTDTDFRDNEKPQHPVRITKPFYLGVHEITQKQYEEVMGVRPWQGNNYVQDGSDYPATYVSRNDAVEFCRKLSEQEGVEYRLPTEAQWEYACRAGTTTIYNFGDDVSNLEQYAWYGKNAWTIGKQYAHRVGQKLPNPWGLYDMHGNIWEWCWDWYGEYGKAEVDDPSGRASRGCRVLRGGSFFNEADLCRSAFRDLMLPIIRNSNVGFRVSRNCP